VRATYAVADLKEASIDRSIDRFKRPIKESFSVAMFPPLIIRAMDSLPKGGCVKDAGFLSQSLSISESISVRASDYRVIARRRRPLENYAADR